jgi:hypothetical protein
MTGRRRDGGARALLTLVLVLAAGVASAAPAPEVRLKDTEYQETYARLVEACEAAERERADDAAAALRRVEEQVLANLPEHVEVTLVVLYSRGINRGAEQARRPFHPYRVAGQCALAAGRPDLAVPWLEKAWEGGSLLDDARKALKAREEAAATIDLGPFLAPGDFAGALQAVERERARLGGKADGFADAVRRAALERQQASARAVAAALGRLDEPGFARDVVAPAVAACARVPAGQETPEIRWIRALDAWLPGRSPAGAVTLAVEAARLDPAFHAFCRSAQEARLREVREIVDQAVLAPRDGRPALLARLAESEKAFETMAAAKAYADLRDDLKAGKARLPVDIEALDRARAGVKTVAGIRAMADELERVWTSDRRAHLSVPDAADLALQLAVYRCQALFLDGRTTAEAAKDYLVREAFRAAPPLPKDASPRVVAVRERIKGG